MSLTSPTQPVRLNPISVADPACRAVPLTPDPNPLFFASRWRQSPAHRTRTSSPSRRRRPGARCCWATSGAGLASDLAALQNSLPLSRSSTVCVRADDSRPGLMRVLITGPDDTPYEKQIFVFDLSLPAAYPREPPAMHYHSWGIAERLNPNLYENGKVCLSLLGTWTGRQSCELWNPEADTVLRVRASSRPPAGLARPIWLSARRALASSHRTQKPPRSARSVQRHAAASAACTPPGASACAACSPSCVPARSS